MVALQQPRALSIDPNPWHVCTSIFRILSAYLHGELSTTNAAEAVDALSPYRRQLNAGESREEIYSFKYAFWEIVVDVARQLPYNSSEASRLFDLATEMTRLTSLHDTGRPLWSESETELSEALYLQSQAPTKDEDKYETYTAWVNMNWFAARIFHSTEMIDDPDLIFQPLMTALEEEPSSCEDVMVCNILAASQWIQYCTPDLQTLFQNGGEEELEGVYRMSSNKYKLENKNLLSKDRWECWMNRFRDYIQMDISDEVTEQAAAAVKALEEYSPFAE